MNQKYTQQHKKVNHTQNVCVYLHILKHDRATEHACSTLCNTLYKSYKPVLWTIMLPSPTPRSSLHSFCIFHLLFLLTFGSIQFLKTKDMFKTFNFIFYLLIICGVTEFQTSQTPTPFSKLKGLVSTNQGRYERIRIGTTFSHIASLLTSNISVKVKKMCAWDWCLCKRCCTFRYILHYYVKNCYQRYSNCLYSD